MKHLTLSLAFYTLLVTNIMSQTYYYGKIDRDTLKTQLTELNKHTSNEYKFKSSVKSIKLKDLNSKKVYRIYPQLISLDSLNYDSTEGVIILDEKRIDNRKGLWKIYGANHAFLQRIIPFYGFGVASAPNRIKLKLTPEQAKSVLPLLTEIITKSEKFNQLFT